MLTVGKTWKIGGKSRYQL